MSEQPQSNGEIGRMKERMDQIERRCDGIESRERDAAHELSRLATAAADRFDQLKELIEDVRAIRDMVVKMEHQCLWCKSKWNEIDSCIKEISEEQRNSSEKIAIMWKVGAVAWGFIVAIAGAKWFWWSE